MSPLRGTAERTFKALRVRNFRLFFAGQLVSVSGTWMQGLAQSWLVLTLTGSAVDLGIAVALQFVPMLVAGSYGGLIVDRFPKRRILLMTQAAAAVLALTLGLLTAFGHPTVWDVYVMAFLLGIVNLFDMPARQTFVQEMVGRDLLPNAVSLNAVLMNSGRIIGPAIGGVVIASMGIPACFFLNSASFAAVIIALALMRTAELTPIRQAKPEKGQVRAGLRYAYGHAGIRNILTAVAVIGIFGFNFQVTVPLLVRETFGGSAADLGLFSTMLGIGAVCGGLFVAHRSRPSPRMLAVVCTLFGVMIFMLAISPNRTLALVTMIPLGATSVAFVSTANATLQMLTEEEMRGRVMALYTIGFLGSTPIGAPLMGAVIAASNPRVGLAVGAVATLAAAAVLARAVHRRTRRAAMESAPV